MERETWATRIGFILAAVGSAVGLGNIWRFPFQVGQNGGSAFLIMYLACVLLIGIPAILVEFVIGRRSQRNPIGAFHALGKSRFRAIGAVCVVTGFVILSYYTVVAGWVLRYIGGSATGAYFGSEEAYFLEIATGYDAVVLHAVFLAVTVGIVMLGIKRGIELAVKAMVPAIALLLAGLAVYALTLDGVVDGYRYYLSPDFATLAAEWTTILPAAVGQALFTLSLGMGVMITYASYVGEDQSLLVDSGSIALLDTVIAFLSGLILFPILFTIDATPGDGGAGEFFIGVGGAFADIPLGTIVGVVFFVTLAVAALSSAISILEVIVSYFIDEFGFDRRVATFGVGVIVFVAGIPAALDMGTFEVYDQVTGELLLPLGMFLLVLFVAWVVPEESLDELLKGRSGSNLDVFWLWWVRTVVTVAVGLTLVLSVYGFAVEFGLLAESA
ncbi:SNF family transport protein [Natronomonas pharaonis DSM 2160]|uniref:SNF family transport protein n=1 Tax=Natronomonas pharaonis (strain ATCC 35678 / DSM 2160 / CIP 103997 / JCM 8858 / NBRC 14720 / NCIMB 2260 / Gabara) TaxID=348780 RepID=A0A1U7EYH7_NATPD|nr:sodium-dependent transporter [Natronomonas pharaonis]CAI50272.1 SNF family transport protein [Natronomonas pharaonis DSM 2160]